MNDKWSTRSSSVYLYLYKEQIKKVLKFVGIRMYAGDFPYFNFTSYFYRQYALKFYNSIWPLKSRLLKHHRT